MISSSSHMSITDLRTRLRGRVIAPQDAGFDAARTIFLGSVDRRPAAILRPVDASDVARAVLAARETGLPLAVRSGGHSMAAHGVNEGGLVLDVRELKGLTIDPTGRTAWAGAGLTAGEYTTAVGEHGLATGFGDTGSVGISGITLGGGIGYLTRRHGLTIDSVLGAEMVTAGGEVLQVDAASHPDLFWAIRGGGNVGVVTHVRYQLHATPQVVGGALLLPATPEVIAGAVEVADAAPEALTALINVMPAPPMPFVPEPWRGQLVVMLLVCYAGDVDAGARAVAPFRTLATPIVDMVRPMRYPELFPPEDRSYRPKAVGRTLFRNTVDRAAASMIVDVLQQSDASMRVVQLRVLGGAMARVPSDATAFAHRQHRILVNVASFHEGDHDRPAREAWVTSLTRTLDQGCRGAYVGFVGDEGESRVREVFPGATWDRLAAVKARYDPTNVFRLNHNVPPASAASGV